MTVQAGIELDLGLWTLVGEMPAIPCESSSHGNHPLHPDAGAATHYYQGQCPKCGDRSPLLAVCNTFVQHVRQNGRIYCSECPHGGKAALFVTILTPIH